MFKAGIWLMIAFILGSVFGLIVASGCSNKVEPYEALDETLDETTDTDIISRQYPIKINRSAAEYRARHKDKKRVGYIDSLVKWGLLVDGKLYDIVKPELPEPKVRKKTQQEWDMLLLYKKQVRYIDSLRMWGYVEDGRVIWNPEGSGKDGDKVKHGVLKGDWYAL